MVPINCLYCEIVEKEYFSDIIFENKKVIAFSDEEGSINGHALLVWKMHDSCIEDMKQKDLDYFTKIAQNIKLTLNNKHGSNHTILFKHCTQGMHAHIHLYPTGKFLDKIYKTDDGKSQTEKDKDQFSQGVITNAKSMLRKSRNDKL